MNRILFILLFIIQSQFCQLFAQNDIWSYLENNCPESIPEVFLPGIVSDKHHEHSSPTISLDGKTIYWASVIDTTNRHTILQSIYENNEFSKSSIAPFSGKYKDFKVLFVEDTCYLCSKRPVVTDSTPNIVVGIWTLSKKDENWSEPVPFHFVSDSSSFGYRLSSLSKDKTLHLESKGFCYSKIENGVYQIPKYWNDDIYSEKQDWMSFISYDNSYMIFVSNRDGGYGSFDLYITFKDNSGNWTTPVNMGDKINTTAQERCPGVTDDGKYLFFTRPNPPNQDDIWWVDANIINELKQETINGN